MKAVSTDATRTHKPATGAPPVQRRNGAGRERPSARLDPRAALQLQGRAGNTAVARLVAQQSSASRQPAASLPGLSAQRLADGGACPAPPVAPEAPSPKTDPKFAAVESKAAGAAKDLKKHPSGKAEAKQAQNAAVPPGDDKASQAKEAQADKMDAAKPKGFDKAAFVAAVKAAVAKAAPQNLDEADKFASSGKADAVKGEVLGKVTEGKQDSAKDVAEKTRQAPDPSVAKDKPVTPLQEQAAKQAQPVDGGKAMPDKAPAEQTDLRAGSCEINAKMADAQVTEEHLEKSNEPQMQDAAKAKKEADAHAATAPAEVRQKEQQVLKQQTAAAQGSAQAAVTSMAGGQRTATGQVETKKSAAKQKEEKERADVSREINAIYDKTKVEVEGILTGLDGKVNTEFETGERHARQEFTAKHKADMEAYKDRRYGGPGGWALWTADLFMDLPAEADKIFDDAKKLYEQRMEAVVNKVADIIGTELGNAKNKIAEGRQKIKEYVASRPKNLQKFANEAATEMSGKFDQLESDVDAKQESLVEDLAQKYVEARNAVDEEIKAEQEKNKGFVSKAKDAVGESVQAIVKLKDLFMGLLARAASAFNDILKDPLKFVGNFMNAVKQGFLNFANNIVEHLKKGLKGWLFGQLADAGIEIPDKLDAMSILKMIASLLGLTWGNIKGKLVAKVPWLAKIEQAWDFLESKVEVFKVLATKGVAGLWNWLKEKVGDLKQLVFDQIKSFVIERIVKAGITWVLGMLNPAGALIKIIDAVIKVVQWIMEKGEQLGDLIGSIVDAVKDVATGGGGGVPAKIEGSLSKAVPVVISFLASLLGLGGISAKVKSILQSAQELVGKGIDAVIGAALKVAKPLLAAAGKLFTKIKAKGKEVWGKVKAKGKRLLGKVKAKVLGGDDSPEGKQKRLDKAMASAVAVSNRFRGKTVGKVVLTGLFGIIRVRYGLTSLTPVRDGERWSVRGEINPTDTKPLDIRAAAEEAVRALGEELHMIIRDCANAVILDPKVVQQIEQIAEDRVLYGRGASREAPRLSQSPAAEAGAMLYYPRMPGTKEFVSLGGRVVSEKQSEEDPLKSNVLGGRPGLIKVFGLGGAGHYDPEIKNKVSALKMKIAGKVPDPDVAIAQAVLQISRGGTAPPPFKAADQTFLSGLTRLLLHVEPGRSPSALVTSMMALETAAGGGVSMADTATTRNPMAGALGTESKSWTAGAQARTVGEQLGYPVPWRGRASASRPAVEAFLEREKQVAIDYVVHVAKRKEAQGTPFKDKADVAKFVQKELHQFLLKEAREKLTVVAAGP